VEITDQSASRNTQPNPNQTVRAKTTMAVTESALLYQVLNRFKRIQPAKPVSNWGRGRIGGDVECESVAMR
jgi:hypothetical protein